MASSDVLRESRTYQTRKPPFSTDWRLSHLVQGVTSDRVALQTGAFVLWGTGGHTGDDAGMTYSSHANVTNAPWQSARARACKLRTQMASLRPERPPAPRSKCTPADLGIDFVSKYAILILGNGGSSPEPPLSSAFSRSPLLSERAPSLHTTQRGKRCTNPVVFYRTLWPPPQATITRAR